MKNQQSQYVRGAVSLSSDDFAKKLSKIMIAIEDLLLEKNRRYGNSALDPIRVFSKADNTEQLKVRIDDKLSRLRSNQNDEDEDVITDLIGYLILLKLSMEIQND